MLTHRSNATKNPHCKNFPTIDSIQKSQFFSFLSPRFIFRFSASHSLFDFFIFASLLERKCSALLTALLSFGLSIVWCCSQQSASSDGYSVRSGPNTRSKDEDGSVGEKTRVSVDIAVGGVVRH